MERFRRFVKRYRRSYTVYSIGCAVVWIIVLSILATTESPQRMNEVLSVFGGFVIGWTSATIARFVYPPPAKWRHGNAYREGASS